MASETSNAGSSARASMEKRLLDAAMSGDARTMKELASGDPGLLLGTTPQGNTCLHIASTHGHADFCKEVLALNASLLSMGNSLGETPLLTAVTSGHSSLASDFLQRCRVRGPGEAILKQDEDGCNALHHAIRSGHRDLALELIAAEPGLSRGVNKRNESPLFIAAMRDFTDVCEKLMEIADFAHVGSCGYNALHAAVRRGNPEIAKKIVEKRPWLAREEEAEGCTPMQLAVLWDKTNELRALLEHDWSLGYVVNTKSGTPLVNTAAYRGHIGVARELLKHCPDAPYRRCQKEGWTCLHVAVQFDQTEFVRFILGKPQFRKLVNMQDIKGNTPLHYAVARCNTKTVAALLAHSDIDLTVLDVRGVPPYYALSKATAHAKTLNWNEVCMLMLKADPKQATAIYNLHVQTKAKVTDASRKDVKSLTEAYTSRTSLVAILVATITFAAAFTLPGGYSNGPGSEGLPVMARKFVFQVFVIADTLAMCSSLAVAFICIVARGEDLEFLLYYRAFTKKLMWFSYIATTTAFATGLYTVLAPRLQWLAIAICVLPVLLPVLTKLLGEWPALKLQLRLGKTFNSDLLDMV